MSSLLDPIPTVPVYKLSELQKFTAIRALGSGAIKCRTRGMFDEANHWEQMAHAVEHNQVVWWTVEGGPLYVKLRKACGL